MQSPSLSESLAGSGAGAGARLPPVDGDSPRAALPAPRAAVLGAATATGVLSRVLRRWGGGLALSPLPLPLPSSASLEEEEGEEEGEPRPRLLPLPRALEGAGEGAAGAAFLALDPPRLLLVAAGAGGGVGSAAFLLADRPALAAEAAPGVALLPPPLAWGWVGVAGELAAAAAAASYATGEKKSGTARQREDTRR
jgi:hypothetical protein